MPGLSQIKKFSSDLLSIGDEITIRAGRGEKPVAVEIPKTVEDVNDSEDFVLGMPEIEAEVPVEVDEDLSDLTGFATPSSDSKNASDEPAPSFAAPDLSSLLNPINVPDDSFAGSEMPDLSMFEDEPEEEIIEEEPEPEEIAVGDMDLDALLAGGGFDEPEEEEFEEEPEQEIDMSATEDVGSIDDLDSILGNDETSAPDELGSIDDLGDVDALGTMDDLGTTDELPSMDDIDAADELDSMDDLGGADELPSMDDLGSTDELPSMDDLGTTDELPSMDDIDAADDLDSMDDLGDVDALGTMDDLGSTDDLPSMDDLGTTDELPSMDDIGTADDLGSMDDLGDTDDLPSMDDLGSTDELPTMGDLGSTDDLPSMDDLGSTDELPTMDDLGSTDDLPSMDDIGTADDLGSMDDLGGTDDLPSMDDLGSTEAFDTPDDFGTENLDSTEDFTTDGLDSTEDFNTDGLDTPDDFNTDGLDITEDANTDGLDSIDDFNTDGLDSTEDFSTDGMDSTEISTDDDLSTATPDGLFNMDDMELPDMDSSLDSIMGSAGAPSATEEETSDFESFSFDDEGSDELVTEEVGDDFGTSDETPEVFDTTDMEGLDFDIPDTDSQMNAGFELGSNDDFAMDSDFEIPGFSDVETAQDDRKQATPLVSGKPKRGRKAKKEELDEPDFTGAMESEELPPNTLSDEQYRTFTKNLNEYPLNVRLAIENLIVQDEFTDDAEFEVIEKVLNKAPARSVASMLEKMLDTSIPVPRDFEHRTAEEYEAYKKSIAYQLKNRIIPAFLIGVVALILCWGLFNFGKNCIYKPLRAVSLYKQGYNLLQASEYPQSEMKFNEAVKYRLSKKWFFNYARGYRQHKQYQRSETMYENILYCFKHDKTAGLEYADMELNDLANYEKAEEIVRREVLDYHINDADGILMLGDIFLEWGTEKDPEMLEKAREQYATLISLYKANDLYLSRMMRYFIRTDNLRQVLQVKPTFEGREKSLSWQDWTELSGYLLDKVYGPLSAADEYLRYQIEGLRGLLIQAVKSNSANPIAQYNLGRYYILSNEIERVEATLQHAISNFNNAETMKTRDIYKYIDSYRLLGEYYKDKDEFLKAQEQYAEGIELYTTERDNAGFAGTPQIGTLYADLADIKYFVSGDYDDALVNYTAAVDLGHDNSSIRYKIGYIQYRNRNYQEALGSFMKAGEGNIKEKNLMLSMANTLSLRGDDYAADGYYDTLISRLDDEIAEQGMVFPQANLTDSNIVTQYLYAANNYGVTLYRLAKRTGNSRYNAQSIVQFQQSVRAWDALTRNQDTLVRLGGSNLAEQNIQYITHKFSDFEPEIYIEIPKTLTDKEHI